MAANPRRPCILNDSLNRLSNDTIEPVRINDEKGEERKISGRRATIKEVAAEVGVSAATVSNAYNRPDQLSPELRERVFAAAKKLGYAGPDPVARGLRRGRSGAVGVVYADPLSYAFADPAAVMFLEGVSQAAEEAGLGLLLVPAPLREGRNPRTVAEAAVDGFVIYCLAEDDPLVDLALERRLPLVLVEQPPREGVPSVETDDVAGARAAAEHLLGLGHESLGVVSFELGRDASGALADLERQREATYRPSRLRLEGYRAAVEDAGLSWEDVPVYEVTENTPEQGRKAAEVLLSMEDRPTAMLALSDQLALGVFEAARKLGLSIPEDLSVVGFDDVPEASRTDPPLTTVYQPHVEKGLTAGRMLVAQLGDEEPRSPGPLPTRLVVRGSTAPPERDR
jgi:DNA-binding LacI/PurR family transcriptional regulator